MNILITIGGTGAKGGESFVYLMAAGLTKEPCKIFVVDKDMDCGNTQQEITTIKSYQEMYETCGGNDTDFVKAELKMERLDFNQSLRELMRQYNIAQTDDVLKQSDSLRGITQPTKGTSNEEALNLLYSKKSQSEKLGEGFYGQPFLGAAVFQAVETTDSYQNNNLYREIQRILGQQGSNDTIKIFLIGSIFGGTGAALFPNIAKSIREKFCNTPEKQKQVQISGALMLPYFSLPGSSDGVDRKVKEEEFQTKAATALNEYSKNDQLLRKNLEDTKYIFDSLYFMGLSYGITSERYSLGGVGQIHKLYIMDLYSSLAACDFFNNFNPNVNEKQIIVPVFPDTNTEMIDWTKLPDPTNIKAKMLTLIRFSTFILTYLKPLLSQSADKIRSHELIGHLYGVKGKFFNLMDKKADISDNQLDCLKRAIETVGSFCEKYLIHYAEEIQSSKTTDGPICNLFDENGIKNIDTYTSFEQSQRCNLNIAIPRNIVDDNKNGDEVVRELKKKILKCEGNHNSGFIKYLLCQIYEICKI